MKRISGKWKYLTKFSMNDSLQQDPGKSRIICTPQTHAVTFYKDMTSEGTETRDTRRYSRGGRDEGSLWNDTFASVLRHRFIQNRCIAAKAMPDMPALHFRAHTCDGRLNPRECGDGGVPQRTSLMATDDIEQRPIISFASETRGQRRGGCEAKVQSECTAFRKCTTITNNKWVPPR